MEDKSRETGKVRRVPPNLRWAWDVAGPKTSNRAGFKSLTGPPPDPGSASDDQVRAVVASDDWPFPKLSPLAANLIECRPYFAMPLGDASFPAHQELVLDEIDRYARSRAAEGRQITNVFVVSHGWHRNLFTGTAAYDRLLSRFTTLCSRGAITVPTDFEPLFVTLQWLSDPNSTEWADPAGRRDKASFMDRVLRAFDPGTDQGRFTTQFEQIFALLSQVSAAETDPLGPLDRDHAEILRQALEGHSLRLAPGSSIQEKVCVLWSCYHESEARAALTDQEEPARPNASIPQAFLTTLKFFVGVAGLAAILGLLKGLLPSPSKEGLLNAATSVWSYFADSFSRPLSPQHAFWMWRLPNGEMWFASLPFWAWATGLTVLPLAILALFDVYLRARRTWPRRGSTPLLQFLLWLPPQVLLTLPVLAFLFVTYLFRSTWTLLAVAIALAGFPALALVLFALILVASAAQIARGRPASAVFRERLLSPGQDPIHLRESLAALARVSTRLAKRTAPEDSFLAAMARALDNQFAFFEMQRKGVQCGDEAGALLKRLLELPSLNSENRPVRLHFIGHSFGGLVVQNAARGLLQRFDRVPPRKALSVAPRYAVRPTATSKLPFELRSLCLVQSATASDWFRGEPDLVETVTGCIACIHSRYDSANGFWYPLANNGRMAAGFVGLCDVGDEQRQPDRRGGKDYVMLIAPPELGLKPPARVNLDGSRLVYSGSIATGGGHDDIFKDDVVNLIWSAVSL